MPALPYLVSDLQQRVSGATIEDLIACNSGLKVARELVAKDIKLEFPVLDQVDKEEDTRLIWTCSKRKKHNSPQEKWERSDRRIGVSVVHDASTPVRRCCA